MKKRTWFVIALILSLGRVLSADVVDFSKKALQSERTRSYDALHYRIRIALDLDQRSFRGETTVTLSSLRERLEVCVLDAEEFTVTSVVSADGLPLRFEQTPTELKVTLARPLAFGEVASFTCSYNGRDPKRGLRFIEKTPDNPRLVFSDSFPDNVHHWFPCYDYPNDKVTNEIIATVASGNRVAANGRLDSVDEDKASGTVTYHWTQELPHSTYLVFLAAGPYVVVRDSYRTLPLDYWVYPQDENKVRPTYRQTARMLEFFNKTFGYDYPWQKYDQVSVPSGGGAESTSATAMTHQIMVDQESEPDFPAIGIVSHELAHQWWGDLVTLRSWAHTWLNESFGTYSDYLYFRYERGDDEGAVNLLGKLKSYLDEALMEYIRPIVSDRYDRPEDMFDAHTYPKGALVLHMLRSLLGEEPFFRTIRSFLHRYAFDVADTHDFIREVKSVTGQNLDWFFDQWLFKPGHPVFDVAREWDEARRVVRVKVKQVQDFTQGIPVFRVPVAIKVVMAQGEETHRVWIREREETFEFPAPARPLLVRFDEGNVLLKEVNFPMDREERLFQLKNDDVIGRMEAAAELAGFGDDARALEGLRMSVGSDPFWAVRKSAVEALARFPDTEAPALLRKACRDANSSVRAAAVFALGERLDLRLIPFFQDLFLKERSQSVRVEALWAMGKTGDPSIVPFLKRAEAVPSHQQVIRRAAQQALELIKKMSGSETDKKGE